MDNMTSGNYKNNEYSFRWGKQFSFLTLKTLNTRLVINSTDVTIEMDRHYLGFIKGKRLTFHIPINSINNLDTKTTLSISDLAIAGVYFAGGFLNPLFFLIVPLSIWACINTNLIMTTKTEKAIKIPSFSKKDAKEFVYFFNDVYIEG